jgi:hypothetical protein
MISQISQTFVPPRSELINLPIFSCSLVRLGSDSVDAPIIYPSSSSAITSIPNLRSSSASKSCGSTLRTNGTAFGKSGFCSRSRSTNCSCQSETIPETELLREFPCPHRSPRFVCVFADFGLEPTELGAATP